jgi:deoxyhypusine synthase
MITDENCFRVLTLSGALTAGQQGKIINDMIELGWFDCVVSTEALMAHGLIQGIGGIHYKVPSDFDPVKLYQQGANVIYDTVELETNMDLAEHLIKDVQLTADPSRVWSSWEICQAIGEYLNEKISDPIWSILKTAWQKKVPIFIPAFTDGELALDIATQCEELKQRIFNFNPFKDLLLYKEMVLNAHRQAKKFGIFIIGGGVPRNWAQQVMPYLDILKNRLGEKYGAVVKFRYGVRICTASVEEGGLSGCSFKEGVTWGKFESREEGGLTAEVVADATLVLPFLFTAVLDRIEGE